MQGLPRLAIPASLNSDLAAGIVNVTIFPTASPGELLDSYLDRPIATPSPAGLTATVTGTCVTFSGPVLVGQIVGILVDGVPYIYNVCSNDSAENIVGNLVVLICRNRLAIASGSSLSIPNAIVLIARVVMNGIVSRELRRQRREIQVNCWCPNASLRDMVAATIDMGVSLSPFISISDGTMAHVRYVFTQAYDQSQNALLYRRDLCYEFEYTEIQCTSAPVMLFGDLVRNEKQILL